MAYGDVLEFAKRNLEWDLDAQEMVDWVEKHKWESIQKRLHYVPY